MPPANSPFHNDLPELPIDCPEIKATANPGVETQLKYHVEQLPGLNRDQCNRLSRLAKREYLVDGNCDPEKRALSLSDLLRTVANGQVAVHPRVTHIIPLDTLDPFLRTVTDILDTNSRENAYQYPAHILECRGERPEIEAIYPPEYHIRTADIVRGLRANDILTSVRRPGRSSFSSEEIQATVEAMAENNESVSASVTLYQPADELEPKLYLDRCTNHQAPPSEEQLSDLCSTLFYRHGLFLDVLKHEDWRDGS